MGLSFDLVEVGWGATVAAEGRELPTASKELLSGLVATAVWVYLAVSALDPE